MINIGCFANYNYEYKSEVKFAKENNFKILQIWYDRNGITLLKDKNPIQEIKNNKYPSIVHALLDINDFDEHIPKLHEILIELDHKEVIIHPVCKSEKYNERSIIKLSNKISEANEIFKKNEISLYVENNSKLDPILYTANEIEFLFKRNPSVKFLLDIAHTDDLKNLKNIINIKYPDMLHVADKHMDVIHEHLPIGDGELDFNYIFNTLLKDYKGNIILEIVKDKRSLIESKKKLKEITLKIKD